MEDLWFKDSTTWRWLRARKKRIISSKVLRHTEHCLADGRFRIVILVGNKRSGNHLFLNWYMSQSRETCILFNNIKPYRDPRTATSEMRRRPKSGLTTIIFSYEDCAPEEIFGGPLGDLLARHRTQIIDSRCVMVARDPRNLGASRFKKWPHEFDDDQKLHQLKQIVRRNTSLVLDPPARLHRIEFVPVLYDAFVQFQTERQALARRLEIPYGDAGLDEVPHYGHGSSFDGQNMHGLAGSMDVLNRWQKVQDDPRFLSYIQDDLIHGLSAAYDREIRQRAVPG